MKFQKILLLSVGALTSLSSLSSCQQDPFEDIVSHERAITGFALAQGQIGVAEITRTAETGNVVVYVVPNTDLTKVVPRIETSYHAEVSPASGVATDFSGTNRLRTYNVTSQSGETRQWTVEIKDYVSDLDGTWSVSNLQFQYFIGEGESWGWNGIKTLASNIPDASKELDNTLTFVVTGVTADGMLTGTYNHQAGPDGQFANFMYGPTDYNYKFRRLPRNQGTWLRNFADNTITFNPGTAQTKTVALEFSADKRSLKMPFNVQPYDIDWNGDGGKKELGGAKTYWYTLRK